MLKCCWYEKIAARYDAYYIGRYCYTYLNVGNMGVFFVGIIAKCLISGYENTSAACESRLSI